MITKPEKQLKTTLSQVKQLQTPVSIWRLSITIEVSHQSRGPALTLARILTRSTSRLMVVFPLCCPKSRQILRTTQVHSYTPTESVAMAVRMDVGVPASVQAM